MVDLGSLGGKNSRGIAINDSGQVAGYSHVDLSPEPITHAFLYAGTPGSGGTMVDLGTLGGRDSSAAAISSAGQVVGSSAYKLTSSSSHAFLYAGMPGADGHMIDLDAWLDITNPAEGAKWTLQYASGINDAGLITGYGSTVMVLAD